MKPPSHRTLLGIVLFVLAVSGGLQWVYGRRDVALGEAIATRAAPGDIQMVSSQDCDYCMGARSWLQNHHVNYTECIIERDAQCRATFQRQMAPGTPLMVVRGQRQVGFDPERILDALTRHPAA